MEALNALQQAFELIKLVTDPIMFGLVFLSGLFQEKYLIGIRLNKENRHDASLKTLLVSFIVASLYMLLVYKESGVIGYVRYFFSFFAATSVYDIAIRPFRKWLTRISQKYFPSDDDVKP